jgi:hypothetical protein
MLNSIAVIKFVSRDVHCFSGELVTTGTNFARAHCNISEKLQWLALLKAACPVKIFVSDAFRYFTRQRIPTNCIKKITELKKRTGPNKGL